MRIVLLMILTAAITACNTVPPSGTAIEQEPLSLAQVMASKTQQITGVAAADRLLDEGEQFRIGGQPELAIDYFERGLRLAPRSAALYLALAKSRMAMGDYKNTVQMAQRAVSLIPVHGTRVEQHSRGEAWVLIEQANVKMQSGSAY